jgi:hypothetical protein
VENLTDRTTDNNCTAPGTTVDINGVILITSQSSAEPWINCTTVKGDLFISGGSELSTLDLGQIESIEGNLSIRSSPFLLKFSAASLKQIGGNFTLSDLAALETLYLPLLHHVNGSIQWSDLGVANLRNNVLSSTLNATEGLMFTGDVEISYTSLENLNFLVSYPNSASLKIVGNRLLEYINITSYHDPVKLALNSVQIQNNSAGAEVHLPNVQEVSSLVISHAGIIDLPALERAGTLNLFENLLSIGDLSVPKLSIIDKDLRITDNVVSPAYGLHLPELWVIRGDLDVLNNTGMGYINMEALAAAYGGMTLDGEFSRHRPFFSSPVLVF